MLRVRLPSRPSPTQGLAKDVTFPKDKCGPTKLWDQETLCVVMISCVIMQNMIVKDENDGVRHGLDF